MDNEFLMSLLPTWHSLSSAMDLHAPPDILCPSSVAADHFFAPYWEKSTESSVFDSALTSPVSPPNPSNDGSIIRELIGKLAGSGHSSPQTYNSGLTHKANAPKWGNSSLPMNPENWRKRKASSNGGKDAEEEHDSAAKRAKQQSEGGNGNENGWLKTEEEGKGGRRDDNATNVKDEELKVNNEKKAAEPPKDYIHVRARRGQATDSHSLAERVRREKISERMKILQDLVPGCTKVTGKALMLDEIINYVQSLQRQVEFLSMKLASVNTSNDNNTNNTTAKDVFGSESIDLRQILPLEYSSSALYGQKNPAVPNISNGAAPQYSGQFPPRLAIREDDLHSIVQMGYGQI